MLQGNPIKPHVEGHPSPLLQWAGSPASDLGLHRVLLGISKEFNAQHITTSLPTASQWLSAVMELVNGFYWRVWYLTHFCSQAEAGEVTQQGLALVQPGKSHPVLLAGKTQIHHIMLYMEASAPQPGWCHLSWTLWGRAKNCHQAMGSVIDAHNCLGCCSFKGWPSWCSELQNNSPCASNWPHSISPQWQVWVCACPRVRLHIPTTTGLMNLRKRVQNHWAVLILCHCQALHSALGAREIKYSSFCWCQWGLKLKTN